MRRHLSFLCEGVTCAATLDEAAGDTGLLIVSGGNEIRCGAHRGMAQLATDVAAAGYPVFRYDRRGIGDSEGENGSFRSSGPDIAAAVATFRAHASVERIVAFGNCDAATALVLFGSTCAFDALVLANPWTFDDDGAADSDEAPALPPASAIRSRYIEKLKSPRELLRLLRGGVDLGKLAKGLKAAAGSDATRTALSAELIVALTELPISATILLAERDRTALAFAEVWHAVPEQLRRCRLETIASASHSFADDAARRWLLARLLDALAVR